jgi:hypothetical protein
MRATGRASDVFAEHDDARVALHLLSNRFIFGPTGEKLATHA